MAIALAGGGLGACGGGDGGSGLYGDAGADGSGSHCTSDDQCKGAAAVCDTRTEECVECLFDDQCSGGEACLDRRCAEQTSCKNSLDCTSDATRPICDPVRDVCVACVSSNDCADDAECVDNECVPFTKCKNSLDCPAGQVCDTALGRCVACILSADCPGAQTCIDNECVMLTPCDSDKDCTPEGKLCDKSLGFCVECLGEADCATVEHCAQGVCKLDVCSEGSEECDGNGIAGCNQDGSGLLPTVPCPSRTTCETSGKSASCAPWVCNAGETYCDANEIVECSDDGLTVVDSNDCGAAGKVCVDAACEDLLCAPDGDYCDGNELRHCDHDGQGFTLLDTCTAGEFCDASMALCRPQVCSPSQPACDGDRATTCNSEGSGYEPGGTDCAAQTKSCSNGSCVDCPGGRGPVRDLRFTELFIGTYDYVRIENRGMCTVDLQGLRFSVRTNDSQNDLDFDLPSHTLAAGESVYVIDSAGALAGDIASTDNLFFTDTSGDYGMLCDGICSASTVIDVVSQSGGMAPPVLPSGVSFTPGPLTGITSTNAETDSYHRVSFSGAAPAFLASDWTVGKKTHGEAPTCPATQPANGSACSTLGASCTYGSVTCSCLFTWSCS